MRRQEEADSPPAADVKRPDEGIRGKARARDVERSFRSPGAVLKAET